MGGDVGDRMLDRLEVTDPDLIRALLFTPAAPVLGGFVAGPAAVAEVSRSSGVRLGRVHYWARRLVALGALTEVSRRRRAGRPIILYRARARSFRVPADRLPEDVYQKLMAGVSQTMTAALAAAVPALVHDGDLTIDFDDAGFSSFNRVGPGIDPSREADGGTPLPPGVVSTFRNLHLTDVEAVELAEELWRVVGRYGHALGSRRGTVEGATTARHLLRLEMAPLPG